MHEPTIFSTHIWHHQWDFVGGLLPSRLHNFNSDFNHNRGKGYSDCIITGLSLRGGGRRFPRLLSKENRRKIEPKQALCCLIPCLLFVFIRQLKILVMTLYQRQDLKASSLRNKTERISGQLEIINFQFIQTSFLVVQCHRMV